MDTAAIAKQYHAEGYAIVRGLFSRDEVARLDQEVEAFKRDVAPKLTFGDVFYEESPARPIKSMFRLNEHAPYFESLRTDPRLLEIVRAIFPPPGEVIPEAVMYFGKPPRDGSVTPAHQDNAFQCWVPPLALTATLAIDASTPENGALTVQRGSPRAGLLPHRQSGVMGFSRCLIDPLDPAAYPEVQLCLNPGDLALHHINTVHRSGANTTDRPRRQLGIGYRSSLAKPDDAAREKYREGLKELEAKAK